jgi:hypothetical protein
MTDKLLNNEHASDTFGVDRENIRQTGLSPNTAPSYLGGCEHKNLSKSRDSLPSTSIYVLMYTYYMCQTAKNKSVERHFAYFLIYD